MRSCLAVQLQGLQRVMLSRGSIPGTSLALLAALATGCVGTDLVDENALSDPEIRMVESSVALLSGRQLQLKAEYVDGFGNRDPFARLVWTSSNPGVAAVDEAGRVSGVAVGQASVTASYNEAVSPAVLVTVAADENSAAIVTITPDTLEFDVGESRNLVLEARNITGEVISPADVTWSSSSSSVVSVTGAGTASALEPGTAEIVATADGISSRPARIVVRGRTVRGTFVKRQGTSYTVSGSVEVRELAGGRLQVVFGPDFITSNGPDVDVYLSKTNQVTGASVSLGDLVSSTGEQTYTVPPGIALDEYGWVIIHCVAFNVTFGFASVS